MAYTTWKPRFRRRTWQLEAVFQRLSPWWLQQLARLDKRANGCWGLAYEVQRNAVAMHIPSQMGKP